MNRTLLLIVFLSLMLTSCESKQLTVIDAWARSGTSGGNSAIYLIIENQTNQDDALLSVDSNVSSAIELHMSVMSDEGTMMMQQQASIPIPAGTRVELRPGGLHIMLINLNGDLVVGETFKVTLNFMNSGKLTLDIPIKSP